jgi:hypothetical protein
MSYIVNYIRAVNRFFNGENNMNATISPLADGRFGLFNARDSLIGTYARARDARRGARRAGLVVA